METNILYQLIDAIEDELSLPSNFILNLYGEDDWSFIVKLHALLESSLTNALSAVVHQGKLEKQFAWLNISDDRIGKIRFAINLDLLTIKQYNFIKKLSEIRNHVIHDIKNINFSFPKYINSLDKNQKKSLKNIIFSVLPDKAKNLDKFDDSQILGDIKSFIVITTFILIANILNKKYEFRDKSVVL